MIRIMCLTEKFFVLALLIVQLLGSIRCGVYDSVNNWVPSSRIKELPENVVLGGFDPYGYYNYVGRIYYSNSILPARVVPETGRATYNTESLSGYSLTYDVLVSNATLSYQWVRSFDGFREKDAVSVGTSNSNERVFICRAMSDNSLLTGTLLLAQRLCFIKYEDLPLRSFNKYEILVRKTVPAEWMPFNFDVQHP